MDASSDAVPRLHVLAAESQLADPVSLDILRELVGMAPPVAVHLRARVPAVQLFEIARDLGSRAWVSGGWCVVNGRPDVALAASVQAVQLGRSALRVAEAAAILPQGCGVRIGASIHDADEARVAVHEGASYLVAGTAYPTPSHPGTVGCGPTGIADICLAVEEAVPVLAIGGVDLSRVPELWAAGAVGVVVGRAIWDTAEPAEAARDLAEALASQSPMS